MRPAPTLVYPDSPVIAAVLAVPLTADIRHLSRSNNTVTQVTIRAMLFPPIVRWEHPHRHHLQHDVEHRAGDLERRSGSCPGCSSNRRRQRGKTRHLCRPQEKGGSSPVGSSEQLLFSGEVALMFGVDPKTVARWANAGLIGSIRTPGGHRRSRQSEVTAFLLEWTNEIPDVLPQPRSLPVRCTTPALNGIPAPCLTVPFGAESSAVVRVSVSGAVLLACYSAGSDNCRCQ